MTYWQIASGSDGRNYSKYFLKYGMAFVGSEFEHRMRQVNEGDIIVLKTGKEILAAGRVSLVGHEDKEWLNNFDGWILSAYCYVDWKKPESQISNSSLDQRAICRIYQQNVIDIANNILGTGITEPPLPEPQETRSIEVSEILNFLKGEMKASPADELKKAIRKIQLLVEHYYKRLWNDTREHEARTFLVIPLLLALGWREEQIKIEFPCSGGKVDIACFRENYTGQVDDECVAIIETKSLHIGLDYAIGQINGYVEADREYFRNCNTAIVTNGHCYKVHLRNGDEDVGFKEDPEDPAAYMNIREPKDKYPLDPENVEGTLQAIKWLSPNTYL